MPSTAGGCTSSGGARNTGRFHSTSARVTTRTRAGGSVAADGRTVGGGRCMGSEKTVMARKGAREFQRGNGSGGSGAFGRKIHHEGEIVMDLPGRRKCRRAKLRPAPSDVRAQGMPAESLVPRGGGGDGGGEGQGRRVHRVAVSKGWHRHVRGGLERIRRRHGWRAQGGRRRQEGGRSGAPRQKSGGWKPPLRRRGGGGRDRRRRAGSTRLQTAPLPSTDAPLNFGAACPHPLHLPGVVPCAGPSLLLSDNPLHPHSYL